MAKLTELELAQRMKAAALKAKQANDLYLEGKITLSECVMETKDHLDYSDNPNNTLALVEALEARDKQVAELRVSNRILCSDAMAKQERIAELEARDIQPLGVQLITEAIGAHAYIVGCLQQNRPDLALEESLKWVQGISQAAVMATEGE